MRRQYGKQLRKVYFIDGSVFEKVEKFQLFAKNDMLPEITFPIRLRNTPSPFFFPYAKKSHQKSYLQTEELTDFKQDDLFLVVQKNLISNKFAQIGFIRVLHN